MEDKEIIRSIGDIYLNSKYSKDVLPTEEWSEIFHAINDNNYIVWSYGFTGGLRQAYRLDKETLRKSLITLLQRYNRDFKKMKEIYPELVSEYDDKIKVNESSIVKLKELW